MDREWNDNQPIYRQLRDRVVAMILDGVLKEGDPLPSVRTVAADYRLNPLTVLKGYQELVDEKLVEKRRGLGMFVKDGARNLLLKGERQKFLEEEWPRIVAMIQRLGLNTEELLDGTGGVQSKSVKRSTTALNAMLGLIPYQGELRVLGRDPWKERDLLMRDVCFIADVAVLPRWIKVSQALDFVAGVHPRFDRAKAEGFLAKTSISLERRVKHLSKGMVAQLHLALIMAIDARLLVLDEPTLGLDILFRKQFYDSLLNDYFDRSRTIIVTTHQVEELQHILTDLLFIERGRVVLSCSMDEVESRYMEVTVNPDQVAAARTLKPIYERQVFGRTILMFDRVERGRLMQLGEVRTPNIADLFVAVMENQARVAQGAAI
ncbi:MAG: hypothetical protein DMG91_09245 [Acidobacteria bacterium]|nr:MAG: hypothetical protein DMG91_09245 [Acidobacteriota bacterium]